MKRAVAALGAEEVESIVEEQGKIEARPPSLPLLGIKCTCDGVAVTGNLQESMLIPRNTTCSELEVLNAEQSAPRVPQITCDFCRTTLTLDHEKLLSDMKA